MTAELGRGRRTRTAFRARLAGILAAGFVPVLVLGALQSLLILKSQALAQRSEMTGVAQRSAADVGVRLAASKTLLTTLVPSTSGAGCERNLADMRTHIPISANLMRFDSAGKVVCAAQPLPVDSERAGRSWSVAIGAGAAQSIAVAPAELYAAEPAVIASVPAGVGRGVISAVIPLSRLRPPTGGSMGPTGEEVAFVSPAGQVLTSSATAAFPADFQPNLCGASPHGCKSWTGLDRGGQKRTFAAAALPWPGGVIVFSAPRREIMPGGLLNPLLAISLSILAFGAALVGVWVVADQTMIRWIAYLQRIAAIYARGRYGIHPSLPEWAPSEIHDLAESLDAMAATIAARDRTLRENLVHKDALLREIHHRVKNNLQVISSLLNMQQRALVDPAARAAISDTRQRISALALIYRALYEGPDLRKVDLRQFLEDLIGQLMVNDAGRRATIRTHLSIDALTIDPDQLAPLSLFAVEAITNARKHGLSDAGGGTLEVIFRVRDAEAELTISDSGRSGGPEPVVGEGVGRTLMMAFARQLAGQAIFCADAGGMTVKLRFPVAQASLES